MPWSKESLGLQVGDFIIWRGEAIELEGRPAVVAPGMTLMLDARMTWEKAD